MNDLLEMAEVQATDGTKLKIAHSCPHVVRRGFLGEDFAQGLFDYIVSRKEDCEPALLGPSPVSSYSPVVRSSLTCSDVGPLGEQLKGRVTELLPELIGELRGVPFNPSQTEMAAIIYGDGGHYLKHIDVFKGKDRPAIPRRVTCLYYFSRHPRPYGGGDLRFYSLSNQEHVDVEAERDMLVAFPSWLPHEVMNVHVPSGEFTDYRFAVVVQFG